MRKRTLIPITLIFLILLPATGQTDGSVFTFDPHPGYTFTAQASADLTWQENTINEIFVNITAIQTPNNISRIYIDLVTFALVGPIGGVDTPITGNSNVPEAVLTINNNTILLNSSLTAPDEFDRFYIRISVFARSDGNTTPDEYDFRFPDDSTILVERDDFVPLIDLYGFPPDAFFKRFLPIYFILFGLMTLPGIAFLGYRVSAKKGTPNNKQEKEEL